MDDTQKTELKDCLSKDLKRPLNKCEEENLPTDALLLAQYLLQKVLSLETRIKALEKKK